MLPDCCIYATGASACFGAHTSGFPGQLQYLSHAIGHFISSFVVSVLKNGFATRMFYGVPRTKPRHFLGDKNLQDHIDCNESDFSDGSSGDEYGGETIIEDSSDDESECADMASAAAAAARKDLKAMYEHKRYTWKKNAFERPNVGVSPTTSHYLQPNHCEQSSCSTYLYRKVC